MPALVPTGHFARITWLGRVPHRNASEIETFALEKTPLSLAGSGGEVHSGLTRPSCSRVVAQHPKGTEIRSVRQVSIVSEDELTLIADATGIESIDPAWLGASVVLDGISDFSHVPRSSRLQAEDGATMVVDMQNRPCQFPAMTIEAPLPAKGKSFKTAADGRRGVTAWVEREGCLKSGGTARLHVPEQRAREPE